MGGNVDGCEDAMVPVFWSEMLASGIKGDVRTLAASRPDLDASWRAKRRHRDGFDVSRDTPCAAETRHTLETPQYWEMMD